MSKKKLSQNYLAVIIFILMSAIAFAWFLEIVMKLAPCSLCLLQRWGIYTALIFLIPAWLVGQFNFGKTNKLVIKSLLLLFGFLGIIFGAAAALRQTYIQLQPEGLVPSCGADLNTLLSIVTPLQAVSKVFQGSGECSEKAWVFLGLSLGMWSAILLIIVTIGLIVTFIKNLRKN